MSWKTSEGTRESRLPLFARYYLPYCMFGTRSQARNGLILDAAVWAAVLLLLAIHSL